MSADERQSSTSALAGANRAILRAAASVAAASVVVKLIATAKEIAVAATFGRSDELDAFLAALLLPSLLVNLLAESMNQALVPTLMRVREREGPEEAQRLLSSALLWLVALLLAVSAAMLLLAPLVVPLVSLNFSPTKRALTLELYCALLPIVMLGGVASNSTAVLNSRDRFLLPTLAPAAVALTVLAALLLAGPRVSVWTMASATLAGTLLQALLVALLLPRHGYRLSLRWHGAGCHDANEAVREVGRQYGQVLGSGLLASGGLLVDQAMAASLAPGSVSALAYANRFVGVALTLMAGAISTAVVPSFSRFVAQEDWPGCRALVRRWVGTMLALAVPIAVALIAGAHWLVGVTLQHGAFAAWDTAVVTQVLAMYALQIPFYVASRVDYRLIVAARRTDLVLVCGGVNLVLDVVLNLVLMRWMGVAGIALATSLWTMSTFGFLRYWAERLMRERHCMQQTRCAQIQG
jgi:putative peptidoglycan lipid II flippase